MNVYFNQDEVTNINIRPRGAIQRTPRIPTMSSLTIARPDIIIDTNIHASSNFQHYSTAYLMHQNEPDER
jgi:hypothetical protein